MKAAASVISPLQDFLSPMATSCVVHLWFLDLLVSYKITGSLVSWPVQTLAVWGDAACLAHSSGVCSGWRTWERTENNRWEKFLSTSQFPRRVWWQETALSHPLSLSRRKAFHPAWRESGRMDVEQTSHRQFFYTILNMLFQLLD